MTLADLIKARGKTARECAAELGIHESYMSRLMRRQRAPTFEVALKIIQWSDEQITLPELQVQTIDEKSAA